LAKLVVVSEIGPTMMKKGKIAQIPAFFENVIVRPVGSLTSSGGSTLKKLPNPNFCRFLFTEQHLIFY
jgi:hypothetical protein